MDFPVPHGEPQTPRRLPSWLDPEAVEARGERHLAMLAKLADMGLASAIVCGRTAQEAAPEKSVRHHDAFVRAGRFAMLAVAHEARIAAGLRDQARREAREDCGAPRRLPDPVRLLARRQLRQWAERTPTLENLNETFKDIEERLDDPDVKTILDRGLPASRIVAVVAEDLGIEVDWKKVPDEVMGIAWSKKDGKLRYPDDDPKNQGGPYGYPVPDPPPDPPPGPPPETPDTG